ncbi:hypothetical protein D5S19_07200 [Amycolatopsis panacis]|uniref:Uncharacterized protein n=1 Tax=Amycolatopsis panacis TaxID=2340917 RepID=A0A419I888_9PSEU|nr:hypothetical protein D5S19_07200 [Amycolatopsis panacis]
MDCDRCAVRGAACGDCAISVLFGPPTRAGVAFEGPPAAGTSARSGPVPRLRLVPASGRNPM